MEISGLSVYPQNENDYKKNPQDSLPPTPNTDYRNRSHSN